MRSITDSPAWTSHHEEHEGNGPKGSASRQMVIDALDTECCLDRGRRFPKAPAQEGRFVVLVPFVVRNPG